MLTVAIDFDHTLVDGQKARAGAKEAINQLREQGHRIIIHSCNDADWIRRVMANNDLRFDAIWEGKGKPIADIYVDDRAFRTTGNWAEDVKVISQILKRQQELDDNGVEGYDHP